ncbi:hypothetical protein FRX31_011084 [Thalictrum thalictroides]|uniref:Uncharacterized protein n=1 Tax=Thalictrum thalictroides TaxID=46969 RepID=A0A7J6WQY1_THATH|nr:hypothetical protein FRX31_011084 [Thalictrum thalictroides]
MQEPIMTLAVTGYVEELQELLVVEQEGSVETTGYGRFRCASAGEAQLCQLNHTQIVQLGDCKIFMEAIEIVD